MTHDEQSTRPGRTDEHGSKRSVREDWSTGRDTDPNVNEDLAPETGPSSLDESEAGFSDPDVPSSEDVDTVET